MPWVETVPMDQRRPCILDAVSDRCTIAALGARDGIRRRVGYTWLARHAKEGRRGL